MYSGIRKIEEVIEYIEQNITANIDCNELSRRMNLSVYEFRRIFSFIIGCPLSEYIRKRRLSLAACEIMAGENVNMLQLSEKYGYTSQAAFTKAFGEQHGVSPTMCMKGECEISLFTRPRFQMSISGGENIPFRVIECEAFQITGCKKISVITDSCCCDTVWENFYNDQFDTRLSALGCNRELYVSYCDLGENVECTIGTAAPPEGVNFPDCENLAAFRTTVIPRSRFACFKVHTVDDAVINEVYGKIVYEWLPSANLIRREDVPTVEVYPFDMSEDGFEWEIRIPVQ